MAGRLEGSWVRDGSVELPVSDWHSLNLLVAGPEWMGFELLKDTDELENEGQEDGSWAHYHYRCPFEQC